MRRYQKIGILSTFLLWIPFVLLASSHPTPPITLNVPFGKTVVVSDLTDYIAKLYVFFTTSAGILAVVMMTWGGFRWIMAAGNAQKIGEAKETILGALTGLVLALASFILLNTINPSITRLDKIVLPVIEALGYLGGRGEEIGTCSTSIVQGNSKSNPDKICHNNRIFNPTCPIPNSSGEDLNEVIMKYTRGTSINPIFAKAIIKKESSFNPDAEYDDNGDGVPDTCGLMQANKDRVKQFANSCGISALNFNSDQAVCDHMKKNPEQAICVGVHYLDSIYQSYSKLPIPLTNPTFIAVAYNGGEGVSGNQVVSGPNAPSKDCPGKTTWECPVDCKYSGGVQVGCEPVKDANAYYNRSGDYVKKMDGFVKEICEDSGGSISHGASRSF